MSEEVKNEEKVTKVNVIRRAAAPKVEKAAAEPQHQNDTEKKVIVLKKKPVVVKVKEKEEEKKKEPVVPESSKIAEPVIIKATNLPPIVTKPAVSEKKEAAPAQKKDFGNVLTGRGYMTNTAVHHQNSRIQSPLHNGPVIIKSSNLPPVPGQKVEGDA